MPATKQLAPGNDRVVPYTHDDTFISLRLLSGSLALALLSVHPLCKHTGAPHAPSLHLGTCMSTVHLEHAMRLYVDTAEGTTRSFLLPSLHDYAPAMGLHSSGSQASFASTLAAASRTTQLLCDSRLTRRATLPGEVAMMVQEPAS